MPRLSLPLLCFGIILVQLDEGRFITKARPKKYDCSEIEKYSRENALQTSGKSVEGEVANWWKGQMPLCSRTQWSFESLADQNSEFLCWRFQFCAQLTPSNEKYWQKGTRKFYSQAIWPSFSRPSTQEGRGTWLDQNRLAAFERHIRKQRDGHCMCQQCEEILRWGKTWVVCYKKEIQSMKIRRHCQRTANW